MPSKTGQVQYESLPISCRRPSRSVQVQALPTCPAEGERGAAIPIGCFPIGSYRPNRRQAPCPRRHRERARRTRRTLCRSLARDPLPVPLGVPRIVSRLPSSARIRGTRSAFAIRRARSSRSWRRPGTLRPSHVVGIFPQMSARQRRSACARFARKQVRLQRRLANEAETRPVARLAIRRNPLLAARHLRSCSRGYPRASAQAWRLLWTSPSLSHLAGGASVAGGRLGGCWTRLLRASRTPGWRLAVVR